MNSIFVKGFSYIFTTKPAKKHVFFAEGEPVPENTGAAANIF